MADKIKMTPQLFFLMEEEVKDLRVQNKLLNDDLRRAVEAMSPLFQSGGEFTHLLTLGKSITIDGPIALAKAYREQAAELTRLTAEVERLKAERVTLFQRCRAVICIGCREGWGTVGDKYGEHHISVSTGRRYPCVAAAIRKLEDGDA